MAANLSGMGCKISPSGNIVQSINTAEPTTWRWEVKPTEPGALFLSFTLSQIAVVERKETVKNYSFRKTVQVQAKPFSLRGFIAARWKAICSLFMIPLLKARWDRFLKTKEKNTSPQPSARDKVRTRLQQWRQKIR